MLIFRSTMEFSSRCIALSPAQPALRTVNPFLKKDQGPAKPEGRRDTSSSQTRAALEDLARSRQSRKERAPRSARGVGAEVCSPFAVGNSALQLASSPRMPSRLLNCSSGLLNLECLVAMQFERREISVLLSDLQQHPSLCFLSPLFAASLRHLLSRQPRATKTNWRMRISPAGAHRRRAGALGGAAADGARLKNEFEPALYPATPPVRC